MDNLEMYMPDNPYYLLTPGPLSTSKKVKLAMFRDWCTWDDDYNHNVVQVIRRRLVELASKKPEDYTTILMQGSGTFTVEAVIGTIIPKNGKLVVLSNGAYGKRIVKIANMLNIKNIELDSGEVDVPNLKSFEDLLKKDNEITHIAIVHNETTTGMMNPIKEIGEICKKYEKIYFIDAMSSFGGVPFFMEDVNADFIVSSANKCIQGVPGFGFTIANKKELEKCSNNARSHSLDLYEQYKVMEENSGKWRFTSPTHVVRAFLAALDELDNEGGIEKRYLRYKENHNILVQGMNNLGFRCLLKKELQSPFITSFYNPESKNYDFRKFYERLKKKGFVIYPGKVSIADCFRIGTIGNVFPDDFKALINAVNESIFWK